MRERSSASGSAQLSLCRVDPRGFTLLELMVTVAVAAILLTIAVPSYQTTLRGNCAISTANSLLALMTLGRSEAERRNQNVTLCKSADGSTCSTSATWAGGAMAFVDLNGDGQLNGSDVALKVMVPLSTCAAIQPNSNVTNYVGFDGSGKLSAQGSFAIVPNGQTAIARQLIVSSPSKLRICNPAQDTTTCGQ